DVVGVAASGESVGAGEQGVLAGIAFLVGAFCSAVAGFIGMYISVRSNLRTAAAAQRSLKDAITVALRGGAVSGFLVVALSLLGVSSIFGIYSRVLGHPPEIAPFIIVGFGFGASFVALFPLVLRSFGILATLVGTVSVSWFASDDPDQNPMTPLNMGFYIVSGLCVVGLAITTKVLLKDAWGWYFACGIVGILTGFAFV